MLPRSPQNTRPTTSPLDGFDDFSGPRVAILGKLRRLAPLLGVDPYALTTFLWNKHRIIPTPIKHAEFQRLRVTPNVYTTLEEIDTFAGAMGEMLKNPPATA